MNKRFVACGDGFELGSVEADRVSGMEGKSCEPGDEHMDALADVLAQDLLGGEETMEEMQAWLDYIKKEQERMQREEETKKAKQTTLEEVVKLIQQDGAKVLVMAGAGLSVSAGIPDFRTPGTGLVRFFAVCGRREVF